MGKKIANTKQSHLLKDVEDVTNTTKGKEIIQRFKDDWKTLAEFGKKKDFNGYRIPGSEDHPVPPKVRRVIKITKGGNVAERAAIAKADYVRHAKICKCGGRNKCNLNNKEWTLGETHLRWHGCPRICKLGETTSRSHHTWQNMFCKSDTCTACLVLKNQMDKKFSGKFHPNDMRGGYGLYLAAVSSRSAPYCPPYISDGSNSKKPAGTVLRKYRLMLCSEVTLGRRKKTDVEHKGIREPPKGYDTIEFWPPEDNSEVVEKKAFGKYGRWRWADHVKDAKTKKTPSGDKDLLGRPYVYRESTVYDNHRVSTRYAVLFEDADYGKIWWKWPLLSKKKKDTHFERQREADKERKRLGIT